MRLLLAPFAFIFRLIVWVRNKLFDWGMVTVHEVGCPVISVGNISVGGTGKTPMILHLLEWATAQNFPVGVVSRGYGRSSDGVMLVKPDSPKATGGAAAYFGDEPALMAEKSPKTPVFVGANRTRAANELLLYRAVKIIFADDAFQHRRLGRSLDIVMIDCLAENSENHLLPQGLLREPWTALRRADFAVLSKANLASAEKLEAVKAKVATFVDSSRIILMNYEIPSVGGVKSGAQLLPSQPVFVVAGIGRGSSFEKSLTACGFRVVGRRFYSDHHSFDAKDLQQLESEAAQLDAMIVMTEKDAVRIKGLKSPSKRIFSATLQVSFSPEIRALYGAIAGLVQ